jgi:hypothetical protein
MPITPFLNGVRFDRETTRVMGVALAPPLGLQTLVAKLLQDAFTQKIGIALTSLGKLDDALGDDLVSTIAPVRKMKGRTSQFECHGNDTPRFGVE